MNTKEFDSTGIGNIVQGYGNIDIQFLNIGFKKEGLFAYCKDILNNYHAIKLEHKHLKCDNNQLDKCLYGKLDEYFGVLDIVIFKTSSINNVFSNKIVELGDKIYGSDTDSEFDITSPFNDIDFKFQISNLFKLDDYNQYSILRIDEQYVILLYLPQKLFKNYMISTEFYDFDIPLYNITVDSIFINNLLSLNDFLNYQKEQKKITDAHFRETEGNTDNNSSELEDNDKWDSWNNEEKMHLDPDRWMNEMLNEADLSYENEWEKEEFEYNKNNPKSVKDNIDCSNCITLIGFDYSSNEYCRTIILWLPSNLSYTLKNEMYEIELVSSHPEFQVENEPEKYEYEYGRYKNVFAFVISKSEIERLKQLNINEDNLEYFLTKIKQDHDLDILTITSETDSSFIFTSYIKPSLYKENIKKDNLPF